MHRRTFIVSLGAPSLSGCLGGAGISAPGAFSDESIATSSTDSGKSTSINAADVFAIKRRGIVTAEVDVQSGGGEFAAVRIENISEQSIGKVTVSAKWMDSDEGVETTTSQWLFAFEPGAVWDAYVPAEDGTSPDDVTITVKAETRKIAAKSLSAPDEEMTIREGAAVLTGTVTNGGTEDVFPTVFGMFLNDAGKIVGGATAPLTNVPTEQSVGFELSLPIDGTPRSTPSDYKLILDTPDGKGCLC